MRNQSFPLTGNDIGVYMVYAEGKSVVRPFPTPLEEDSPLGSILQQEGGK